VGNDLGILGLRFLARHLVTFDFPKRTMYLKQTSIGPLPDEKMERAAEFLRCLKQKGQVTGWSENDEGTIILEAQPESETFDFRKNSDSSACHYRIIRASQDDARMWQKA